MTKTKTTPCRAAFDASRALRQEHPLDAGCYKLEEAYRDLLRARKTVVSIAEGITGRAKYKVGQSLGSCTTDDKAHFLKGLPKAVASLLGGQILPGIVALDGDGVSKATVRDLATSANRTAQTILEECDMVHRILAGGIQREYDAMRRGSSYVIDLLDQALALTERGLKAMA